MLENNTGKNRAVHQLVCITLAVLLGISFILIPRAETKDEVYDTGDSGYADSSLWDSTSGEEPELEFRTLEWEGELKDSGMGNPLKVTASGEFSAEAELEVRALETDEAEAVKTRVETAFSKENDQTLAAEQYFVLHVKESLEQAGEAAITVQGLELPESQDNIRIYQIVPEEEVQSLEIESYDPVSDTLAIREMRHPGVLAVLTLENSKENHGGASPDHGSGGSTSPDENTSSMPEGNQPEGNSTGGPVDDGRQEESSDNTQVDGELDAGRNNSPSESGQEGDAAEDVSPQKREYSFEGEWFTLTASLSDDGIISAGAELTAQTVSNIEQEVPEGTIFHFTCEPQFILDGKPAMPSAGTVTLNMELNEKGLETLALGSTPVLSRLAESGSEDGAADNTALPIPKLEVYREGESEAIAAGNAAGTQVELTLDAEKISVPLTFVWTLDYLNLENALPAAAGDFRYVVDEVPVMVQSGCWMLDTLTGRRFYTYCVDPDNPYPGEGVEYDHEVPDSFSDETRKQLARILYAGYPNDKLHLSELMHSTPQSNTYEMTGGFWTQMLVWAIVEPDNPNYQGVIESSDYTKALYEYAATGTLTGEFAPYLENTTVITIDQELPVLSHVLGASTTITLRSNQESAIAVSKIPKGIRLYAGTLEDGEELLEGESHRILEGENLFTIVYVEGGSPGLQETIRFEFHEQMDLIHYQSIVLFATDQKVAGRVYQRMMGYDTYNEDNSLEITYILEPYEIPKTGGSGTLGLYLLGGGLVGVAALVFVFNVHGRKKCGRISKAEGR